jgi:hypothetical protein
MGFSVSKTAFFTPKLPFSPFFSIMFVLYKSEEYYSVIWYEQEGGLLSESVKGERH